MARPVVVVDAFLTVDEAAQSAGLTKGVETFVVATSEELVNVALMRDVEHEPVPRGVEGQVDGDHQFHHTEVRPEVPPVSRGDLDDASAQFAGQLFQFAFVQFPQVGGGLNLVEQAHVRLVQESSEVSASKGVVSRPSFFLLTSSILSSASRRRA